MTNLFIIIRIFLVGVSPEFSQVTDTLKDLTLSVLKSLPIASSPFRTKTKALCVWIRASLVNRAWRLVTMTKTIVKIAIETVAAAVMPSELHLSGSNTIPMMLMVRAPSSLASL